MARTGKERNLRTTPVGELAELFQRTGAPEPVAARIARRGGLTLDHQAVAKVINDHTKDGLTNWDRVLGDVSSRSRDIYRKHRGAPHVSRR